MNSGQDETAQIDSSKSALQDNLDRKGKNAYYFAHAHKATGPKWDGKEQPKLLKRESTGGASVASSSFDYSKSTITTYAFLDDGPKVKLYVNLDKVGEKCQEEDIVLDFGERSLSLVVRNYSNNGNTEMGEETLRFARLAGNIVTATFRLKPNRIIITLEKVDKDTTWHTINDKGTPDHEVV